MSQIDKVFDKMTRRNNPMSGVEAFPIQKLKANPIGQISLKDALEFHKAKQLSTTVLTHMFRNVQLPVEFPGDDAA